MYIDRVFNEACTGYDKDDMDDMYLGPKEFPLSFNESKEDAENLFEQISAETKLKAFSC